MRYELTKHLRKHDKNWENVDKDVLSVETGSNNVVCEICGEDCREDGLEMHMSKHEVKPIKCECMKLFYAENEYKKHIGECETVTKGESKVEQVFIKKEAVKKECVDD